MKRKLRLSRDTVSNLTPSEIEGIQNGADGTRGGCTLYRSCALSCGGTCFEITCAPSACF